MGLTRCSAAALGLWLALSGLPAGAAGKTPAQGAATAVRPVRGAVGGVQPAEWTARWWRWTRSFPDGLQPYLDRDGSRCAMNQDEDGPVWFLAGTDGNFNAERRCRIPLGKHVLVPLINMYYHAPRFGRYAHTCEQVKAQVTVNNDRLVSAVVVLDGRRLDRQGSMRLTTAKCFDPFAEIDASGPPTGPYHAAADGYWLLLPPLSPGRHRLTIGANYGSGEDEDFGRMIQNFEYELEVGDPVV